MLLTEAEVRRLVKHIGVLEKQVEERNPEVSTNPGFLGLVSLRRRLLLEEQVELERAEIERLDAETARLKASVAANRAALKKA